MIGEKELAEALLRATQDDFSLLDQMIAKLESQLTKMRSLRAAFANQNLKVPRGKQASASTQTKRLMVARLLAAEQPLMPREIRSRLFGREQSYHTFYWMLSKSRYFTKGADGWYLTQDGYDLLAAQERNGALVPAAGAGTEHEIGGEGG